MVIAAPRYLQESDRHSGRFDLPGAVCSTLGMALLVCRIVRSADAGWTDPVTIVSLAVGLLLLVLLVTNERRAEQPIMPLRLFRSRERSGAYAARILFLGAMMGFWFFSTQYLQVVHGYTALQAGLGFLPMTVVNFAVAVAVPRLTARYGNGLLLAGGLVLTLIGMAWLTRLSAGSDYLSGVALPMVLIGAGQGATLSPLTAAGIAGASAQDAGAASGLVNVAHQLGGSLGLGILVTIFATVGTSPLTGSDLLAHRVSVALTAGSVMLALALITVISLIVRPLERDDVWDGGLVVTPAAAAGAQLAADPSGRRTR